VTWTMTEPSTETKVLPQWNSAMASPLAGSRSSPILFSAGPFLLVSIIPSSPSSVSVTTSPSLAPVPWQLSDVFVVLLSQPVRVSATPATVLSPLYSPVLVSPVQEIFLDLVASFSSVDALIAVVKPSFLRGLLLPNAGYHV